MKCQDIGVLLKLVSLHEQENSSDQYRERRNWPHDWGDWDDSNNPLNLPEMNLYRDRGYITTRYTARALEEETHISKSQINLSINRCYDVGLLRRDRHSNIPRVNIRALFDFIVYGLKYVFPAKPGEITRGIATAFAAPVLKEKLMSAGEFSLVWPDARGNTKGQAIQPLFKSATFAVRQDPKMYALLALVDAIRVGHPREANLATEILSKELGVEQR